jgi:hypothetical protein
LIDKLQVEQEIALHQLLRSLFVLAFILFSAGHASAMGAIVKRQAALHSEPSNAHIPFMFLEAQEDVELMDPSPTSGYYHVRTSDGDEGWIYSLNIEIITWSRSPTSR